MLSIRSFVSRKRDSEEGFTLIELMVVVLIIAILIAIAIPQFLGARSRAQDRAAQSSLRNALTAAKTAYTDASSYGTATQVELPAPCTFDFNVASAKYFHALESILWSIMGT